MDLDSIHDVAVAAAREAGQLLRQGLNEQKIISRKSSAVDLLTEHDQAAEALITDRLQAAFPDHRLIGEEGTQNDNPEVDNDSLYTWYIDPLDGTNNFSHGFPVFAVSLGLSKANDPLVGVIYDPTRDECFSAISGRGAYLSISGKIAPIHVSETRNLLESLLATGFPYDRHETMEDNMVQVGLFLKEALGIRRAGAAALDLAYVACGRLDGFWELKLSSWDAAAGILLVQEAGGQISTVEGRPWHVKPEVSMVASNGLIHQKMLAVLAQSTRLIEMNSTLAY